MELVIIDNQLLTVEQARQVLFDPPCERPAKWTKQYKALHGKRVKSNRKLLKDTKKYKEFRRVVLKRDNFTCVSCLQVGGYLEVHHIKPKKQFPELALEPENGVTLCFECHCDAHPKLPRRRPWKIPGITQKPKITP